MGMSADIKVIYGVDIGDIDDEEWCPNAWDADEGETDHDKVEVMEKETGAGVHYYGHGCSDVALGIRPDIGIIEWSGPFDPSMLVADPSWESKVRDLASRLGVDIGDRRIGWLLLADYG